jgi:hypothetical protein
LNSGDVAESKRLVAVGLLELPPAANELTKDPFIENPVKTMPSVILGYIFAKEYV